MGKLQWDSFSKDKLENIQRMYNKVKNGYAKNGHAEIALVFLAQSNDQHVAPLFYDTTHYKEAVDAYNHGDLFRSVRTQKHVDELKTEAEKHGRKYFITAFHNHRTGTFFGFVDFFTFIQEDCMIEAFLDASTDICYLIKQNGKVLTPQDADTFIKNTTTFVKSKKKEFAMKSLAAFKEAETIRDDLEKRQVFGKNRTSEHKKRLLSALNNILVQETLDLIRDEVLDEANQALGHWFNWARLSKVRLASQTKA